MKDVISQHFWLPYFQILKAKGQRTHLC